MGVVLEARDVAKSYGKRRVIDGFDLTVERGECVALVGENGSGKTTFLELCAGMLEPDAGTIATVANLGYCPQEPGVVDQLSADDHLALFGVAAGLTRREALAQGRQLLDEFGFPVGDPTVAKDLSGGTRQKLNLALALLGAPQLLLLDEPYQGFDHGSYVDFWSHVDTWRARGCGVVVVTHLLTEQQRVDRTIELSSDAPVARRSSMEVPA